MKRALPFLLLFAVGFAQAADVLWVDDTLSITLRAGQGNEYKILRMLESGTRVEVLQREADYALVRDPKGTEGWVRLQSLTDRPIARDRLVAAEKKIAALEADRQQLKEKLGTLEGEHSQARKTGSQLEKEQEKLQKELSDLRQVAAAPIRLHEENQAMRDRVRALEHENSQLSTTNEKLRDDSERDWFITGAGVLGGGILLGLILPKLRRRKSSWGDL